MKTLHRPLSSGRLATVLGLLACVGPFAIDMYLPALPAIAADLGAPISAVQGTLIAYFIAFGVSQLAWGPISDQVGRKPPLVIGLGIFLVGSVFCAIAPSIGWLTAARFIGGALQMVLGGLVVALSGPFFDGSTGPMVAAIAACGVLSAALAWTVLPGVRLKAAVQPATIRQG